MKDKFRPSPVFRNPHAQSVLASMKLRLPFVRFQARKMLKQAEYHILDCGKGIRLLGKYSAHGTGLRDMVILIHGWEGSSDSVYLLSAASFLFRQGFDIFRLNLRDHGDSHHLNPELFHSCRLEETVGAVRAVQDKFAHRKLFLAGFSLGGNFGLRIAVRAPEAGIQLAKVVAVSPVLNPLKTMDVLENGPFFYHSYFMGKWRRSLRKKFRLFPHLHDLENLSRFPSLGSMTEYFAPRHTGFSSAKDYLNGYALTGNVLENLMVPSYILASRDDPVIPADDLALLSPSPHLHVELTQWGGHCGFIQNTGLNSYAEKRMAEIFQS
ncbi:MAG: alpha/beta fold hydrolase [Desulfobacterales bacterium]